MMDGVTILRTYSTFSDAEFVFLFLVELAVVCLGAFYTLISVYTDERLRAVFGAIATIAVFCGFLYIWPRVKRHEVALTDGVSWTEFTTRYEVLSVNGNILTVRDRTEE